MPQRPPSAPPCSSRWWQTQPSSDRSTLQVRLAASIPMQRQKQQQLPVALRGLTTQ